MLSKLLTLSITWRHLSPAGEKGIKTLVITRMVFRPARNLQTMKLPMYAVLKVTVNCETALYGSFVGYAKFLLDQKPSAELQQFAVKHISAEGGRGSDLNILCCLRPDQNAYVILE
jgi:hypothetical protein